MVQFQSPSESSPYRDPMPQSLPPSPSLLQRAFDWVEAKPAMQLVVGAIVFAVIWAVLEAIGVGFLLLVSVSLKTVDYVCAPIAGAGILLGAIGVYHVLAFLGDVAVTTLKSWTKTS